MLSRRLRRRLAIHLAGGLLGLGAGFPALAGDLRTAIEPPPWPEVPTRLARNAVLTPFQMQAQNGMMLDQTLWNFHFIVVTDDKGKVTEADELSPSGMALLDRLARRYVDTGCVFNLYLQTGRDVPYNPEKVHEMLRERAERDQKRVLSIGAYLAANWPGVPGSVHVYDPNMPGLRAIEAVQAVQEMWRGARGALPIDVQGGLSITPQKLLSGAAAAGSSPPPSPVSSGTGSGGALGADAGGP
jgi:hypothetical protein